MAISTVWEDITEKEGEGSAKPPGPAEERGRRKERQACAHCTARRAVWVLDQPSDRPRQPVAMEILTRSSAKRPSSAQEHSLANQRPVPIRGLSTLGHVRGR